MNPPPTPRIVGELAGYTGTCRDAFPAASGTAPLIVRWTNNDTVDHDIVGTDGTSSPMITPGGAYERRFDRAGTYTCSIHPFMTGTVTIR